MLHFTDSDLNSQSDDNFSYKRRSEPCISECDGFEKLEALKRDFLPKSLAVHISLAKASPQDPAHARAPNSRAGLGFGAMALGASAKQLARPAPAEVVINVGSADPANTSGSAVSETDRSAQRARPASALSCPHRVGAPFR